MQTENTYVETDLGNIALNPRGEYDAETLYEYLDTVSYRGGSYVCLAELSKTINNIAPEEGKNTEHWQMLTLPGGLTSDYIAMHDDVVNKAKQVETSRAAVELSQQEVEAAQADVSQMWQATQEASEMAVASRDSAAGYAQSAEASRTAAKESEDNINAQVAGFDTHVAEKTSAAESAVEEARKTAIDAITTQQDTSTKAVNDAGIIKTDEVNAADKKQVENVEAAGQTAVDAIETQQGKSEKAVSDKATEQISAINTAGDTQVTSINTAGSEQVIAVEGAGAAQVESVENTGDEQTVNITKAAAEELIKLQAVAAEFAGDHEQIETNKGNITTLTEKKIQAWFPGKTTEEATISTKEVVLSDTAGNPILDLDGNEIGVTVEVVAPKPPYYLGDLWVSDDAIYICTTAREDGNFKNFDWMKILERK